MKFIALLSLLFLGVAAYAQTDSVTTEWATINTMPQPGISDTTWETSKMLCIRDTVLIPSAYTQIKVQYRENAGGIVQQRQRYYFLKKR